MFLDLIQQCLPIPQFSGSQCYFLLSFPVIISGYHFLLSFPVIISGYHFISCYHFLLSFPVIISCYHFWLSFPVIISRYHFPLSFPVIISCYHFRLSFPVIISGYHLILATWYCLSDFSNYILLILFLFFYTEYYRVRKVWKVSNNLNWIVLVFNKITFLCNLKIYIL